MIEVSNLTFSYSHLPFMEQITFDVKEGEIFGFLGPSGAGKSTLQKILIGLLTGYSGKVSVAGFDVGKKPAGFYETIGVGFEFPNFYEKFTAAENLDFFSSLYQTSCIPTADLLSMVGLSADADKKVASFSKGMKSRLNFVKAIAHRPKVLFLDEPTSGLDPTNAQVMKNIIKQLRADGTTIIITTHNMHDATELCDRVAFIVEGKIRALDTPHQLMLARRENKIAYSYLQNGVEMTTETLQSEISKDGHFMELLAHNQLLTIHTQEPSLDDVFREITGRSLK